MQKKKSNPTDQLWHMHKNENSLYFSSAMEDV